jgi:hypothetical protein
LSNSLTWHSGRRGRRNFFAVSSVCVVKMSLGVPAVSVGDKFPTTPVVHVGFPKAKTIAELLEGKSKVLFVSLPGAFTPT